jgi:hypothetical protein
MEDALYINGVKLQIGGGLHVSDGHFPEARFLGPILLFCLNRPE